jgi:hypothetical protein
LDPAFRIGSPAAGAISTQCLPGRNVLS